jgi:hypothetical protein
MPRRSQPFEAWVNGALLTTVALTMFSQVDAIVARDPELAAVIICERVRKLQARYEALNA